MLHSELELMTAPDSCFETDDQQLRLQGRKVVCDGFVVLSVFKYANVLIKGRKVGIFEEDKSTTIWYLA